MANVATLTAKMGTTPVGVYSVVVDYPGDDNHSGSSTSTRWEVQQAELPILPAEPEVASDFGAGPEVTIGGLKDATGVVAVTYLGPDGEELPFCQIELPGTSCTGPEDLPAGQYRLFFRYAGDANFAGSVGELALTVEKRATQVTTEERFTTTEGEAVDITVGGLPEAATGTVTVAVTAPDGPDGLVALRAPEPGEVLCTIDVAAAEACATPDDLDVGEYDLMVVYEGDANHEGSSVSTVLEVQAAEETTEPTEPTDPAEPTEPGSGSGEGPGEVEDPAAEDPAAEAPAAPSPVTGGGGLLARTGGPALVLGLLGTLLLGSGGAALVSARRRRQS